MSRLSTVRAGLAAAGLMAACVASAGGPDGAITIDVESLKAAGCIGNPACSVGGAEVSSVGGVLAKKYNNGVIGVGVSGGPSGDEIDIGQAIAIGLDRPRPVVAFKVLFLYNGPEYGDRAEKARVVADGTAYTLSVRGDANDANADWSGPGTVTKCGATTSTGTGCFVVTDPFPGAVSQVEFTAIPGGQPYPPGGGAGSSESDYALGFIDFADQAVLDLVDCAGPDGCPVATVGGNVAFGLNSVQVENPGGSTEALVIPVRIPDCRYVPQACLDLLPPAGDYAASDDAAREILVGLGVIKALDPYGPYRLHPAAQLLNVTPLLPAEVTSLFDGSGTPPHGLPPLYVGSKWRGQSVNDFRFDGFFFKTDTGVVFSDAFEGLVDVSLLTGDELGCVADTGNLLAWDVITTVSELARSVGGRHVDSLTNVGCINPTKVKGSRLSLYSVNLEVVPDTFGPTIKSKAPKVTENNDAVFARLVQSLWEDLGETKGQYACRRADPVPAAGPAPLARKLCRKLGPMFSQAKKDIRRCVNTSFRRASSKRTASCAAAEASVAAFSAALPASASGPDPYNRLGELKARVEVFQHVWDERFLNSQKPKGFCREKGTCPP